MLGTIVIGLAIAAAVLVGVVIVSLRSPRSSVRIATVVATVAFVGSAGWLVVSTAMHLSEVMGPDAHIMLAVAGSGDVYFRAEGDTAAPIDARDPNDPTVRVLRGPEYGRTPSVLVDDLIANAVIWDPSLLARTISIGRHVLVGGLAVLVSGCALLMLRSARGGRPFSRRATRAIRTAGVALLIGLPLLQLLDVSLEMAVMDAANAISVMPEGGGRSFDFVSLLPGIGVLALAAIWTTGSALEQLDAETI